MFRNKILSALCLVCLLINVNAQKDDVEWLFPPGANDVFNQAFGPPDFFGPPQGPQGLGPPGLGGPQGGLDPQGPQGGQPGFNDYGRNTPGYKVGRGDNF